MRPSLRIVRILGFASAVWTGGCLHTAPAGSSGVLTLDRLVGELRRQGVTVSSRGTESHESLSFFSVQAKRFSNTGANAGSTLSTKPNQHDFDELNIIYQHLDTTTTVAAQTSPAAPASDVTEDPNSWGQLMSQSPNGRSSTYENVNRDGSRTITHVYWTLEAAAACPSCDHRMG